MTIRSSRLPFFVSLLSGLFATAVIGFFAIRSAIGGQWLPALLGFILIGAAVFGIAAMWSVTTLTVYAATVRFQPPHRAPIVVPREQIHALVRPTPGKSVPLDVRDANRRLLMRIQASFAERDLEALASYLGITIESQSPSA